MGIEDGEVIAGMGLHGGCGGGGGGVGGGGRDVAVGGGVFARDGGKLSGRRGLGDGCAVSPSEHVPEAHSIERGDEMSLRELEAHSLRLLSAEVQRLSGGGEGRGWGRRLVA